MKPLPEPKSDSPDLGAYASVAICAFVWGTTWYAITYQLGAAHAAISVILRFGLAALGLAIVAKLAGNRLSLTRAQHLAAAGQGLFAFSISYFFVYAAEEKIASAVVAIIFAALAFVNLALFRLLSKQKASAKAWVGASLGVFGVGVLSAGEITGTGLGNHAVMGVTFAVIAVLASAMGNWCAWRGQQAGAQVLPATAWAMAYGTAFLAVYALATGIDWQVQWSAAYIGSLIYLSLIGSVLTFGLYFTLARKHGYALASYISALTPPIAMVVSVLFEGARFGVLAFVGLGIVLAGQVFMMRAPRKSAA